MQPAIRLPARWPRHPLGGPARGHAGQGRFGVGPRPLAGRAGGAVPGRDAGGPAACAGARPPAGAHASECVCACVRVCLHARLCFLCQPTPSTHHATNHNAHAQVADLSLIVFDEAHHCSGNDTYAQILRDFVYATSSPAAAAKAPRILALTASPQPNLHAVLGCRVATATAEERCVCT